MLMPRSARGIGRRCRLIPPHQPLETFPMLAALIRVQEELIDIANFGHA